MNNKHFMKAYLSVISEAAQKKDEAQNDYDAIVDAVVDEMEWTEAKAKAVKDLLYMYKKDKYTMDAIKNKMNELLTNQKFYEEYASIMEDFFKLNLDMKRYQSLQVGFNEMMDNPNYDNRRNFMRRVARWLDKEDAKTVVALNEVEDRLRKLVKKYTVDK